MPNPARSWKGNLIDIKGQLPGARPCIVDLGKGHQAMQPGPPYCKCEHPCMHPHVCARDSQAEDKVIEDADVTLRDNNTDPTGCT